ncbi:hypothetical protein MSB04_04985 [bacterium]|nr:hypothetical protein [bacterium]
MGYQVKNFKGEQVAKFLVDGYLNSFCSDHTAFMEAMSMEQTEVQENFTYLVYAWLKGLEAISYYDLRNEASVLLACELCSHIKEEPVLHVIPQKEEPEMETGSYEEHQVERVMADYLVADSENAYQGFIDYALRTHRTLQQNLTRFFMEWMQREKKNSLFIQNANILLEMHQLPYI